MPAYTAPRPHHHINVSIVRIIQKIAGGLNKGSFIPAQVGSIITSFGITGQCIITEIELICFRTVIGYPKKELIPIFKILQAKKTIGDMGAVRGMLIRNMEVVPGCIQVFFRNGTKNLFFSNSITGDGFASYVAWNIFLCCASKIWQGYANAVG